MKNFTYAEELFRRGSEIQPDDVGSHMNLGRVLKAMGRLQEAEQVICRHLSLGVVGEHCFWVGLRCYLSTTEVQDR